MPSVSYNPTKDVPPTSGVGVGQSHSRLHTYDMASQQPPILWLLLLLLLLLLL